MIKKFKQWLANRKISNDEKLHYAGYNYAAGQLLELGKFAIDLLEQQADAFDRNSFDVGINCAVYDFKRQCDANKMKT